MDCKGDASVISVLGIVIVAAVVVIFIVTIVPNAVSDTVNLLSMASAEVVSRNLGGLITISAAAPNEIKINYQPSENYEYKVTIDSRVVTVKLTTEKYGMKGESVSKTAINSKCFSTQTVCQLNDVNQFTIEKWTGETGYACNVEAS